MVRASIVEEIAAVSAICHEIGWGPVTPTVLKAAHHTTFLIVPRLTVARVQSGEAIEAASRTATKEIAVARHLAGAGMAAASSIDKLSGPHVSGSCVVTFWAADEQDGPLAAMALERVHRALRDFGGSLPPYTSALDRCWAALIDDSVSIALAVADRRLLKAEFRHLRDAAGTMEASWTPLHGDAHLGNFVLSDRGNIWLDFEDACVGPREYDIASLPAEIWPSFTDTDPALVAVYAHLKSVCVAVWCSADASRSREIREAADYHLDRIRELAR